METVSKRELNQNTAAVLGRVTDSVDVVVTERGVPRWRVSVYRGPDDTLARLEREGHYTPPSPPLHLGQQTLAVASSATQR